MHFCTGYVIVRHYHLGFRRRVIARGLTAEEARRHCADPATSSRTSTRRGYTARVGPWFDGFEHRCRVVDDDALAMPVALSPADVDAATERAIDAAIAARSTLATYSLR